MPEQYGKLQPRQGHPHYYNVIGLKIHSSETCVVILAVNVATNQRIALKFMANEEEWQRVQEVLAMLDIELPEIR